MAWGNICEFAVMGKYVFEISLLEYKINDLVQASANFL